MGSILSTVSGPALPPLEANDDPDHVAGQVYDGTEAGTAGQAKTKLVCSKALVQQGAAAMPTNPDKEPALIFSQGTDGWAASFIAALGRHRYGGREPHWRPHA